MKHFLSADLGGTKTILRLTTVDNRKITECREEQFVSAAFPHLRDIVKPFITGTAIDSACFAVAGPVSRHSDRETAEITNLPWVLDSHELSNTLNINSVRLINDFQAIGYGIDYLEEGALSCIQKGKLIINTNRAIIGAGTGLGQAFMTYEKTGYKVHSCEGGHVDFAPNNAEELALLEFLQHRYGHVSYERMLSGGGLVNIYEFLKHQYPKDIDHSFEALLYKTDAPAAISQKDTENPKHLAARALSMFVTIYGAQAGNMVLNYSCSAGVYIAGGIAAKIESVMNSNVFRQAFNDKGRMSKLTLDTPVFLITDSKVGLYGAENIAIRSIA